MRTLLFTTFTPGILGNRSADAVTSWSLSMRGNCDAGGAVPSVIHLFIATTIARWKNDQSIGFVGFCTSGFVPPPVLCCVPAT